MAGFRYYRIEMQAEYSWAEFAGYRWRLYLNDLPEPLASGLRYWKWTARRAARKAADRHAQGLVPVPAIDAPEAPELYVPKEK